jgi:hypothetical protein
VKDSADRRGLSLADDGHEREAPRRSPTLEHAVGAKIEEQADNRIFQIAKMRLVPREF